MKEELISFETAKLAKEKGFNEPQFNGYLNEQLEKYTSKSTHEQCIEEYYLAPTQGLLQKWLRDIYNIEVDVMRYTYSGGEYQGKCYMWAIDKYDPNYNPETEDPWILETRESQGYDFKVYEEALEEGLYQALLLV